MVVPDKLRRLWMKILKKNSVHERTKIIEEAEKQSSKRV